MSALRPLACVSFIVVAVFSRAHALEAGPRAPIRPDRPLNQFDRSVIERVRARAAALLDGAECAKVLTDFNDRNGRTLEENLEPWRVTASQYLLQLSFVDGSRVRNCRDRLVMMATRPGMPRVFVCPAGGGQINSRLAQVEFRSGNLAEAMVIHEMLHTLGLGENPPSTFEITQRVRDRCH